MSVKAKPLPDENAAALIARIRRGDEDAFAELAEQYRGMTESAVRRFYPSFGETEGGALCDPDDLRQVAALALYRAAVSYDAEEKGKTVRFGLYAKICVNNALISELRKHRAEKNRRESGRRRIRDGNYRTPESDPLAILISAEDSAGLMREIQSGLAPLEKEVFDLYSKGMSIGSIADRLRKDRKSVSNALYRVKVKLKGLLRDRTWF